MKKKSFKIPFRSNFFKEQDPFHLVIVFFIIFFGTAVFFSIPTFYDYKNYNQKIEKTINKEFKIKMHNLKDISFKFIPSPHLLIKKADLKIRESETDSLAELKNIKVFISISDLYYSDSFKIKRIVVSKANFYLQSLSLKNFIINLKKNIVNNFIIKNSTIFFKDQKKDIILISKIKSFDYKIDIANSKKILKIIGNIFDSDFEFKYFIDYNEPNVQNAILHLQKPNLTFENKLKEEFFSNSSNSIQKGNLNIKFLNLKNSLDYEIENSNINFQNKDTKNSNFDLNGSINVYPFHFNLVLDINKINLEQLEKLFFSIYKNQKAELENLSGDLIINFKNIENKIINNGSFKLLFENSTLNFSEKFFNLNNFASMEIREYEYLNNSDQILQMKIKLNIFDQEKFNRFLFKFKKNKIFKKKLYFIYQFNVDTKTSLISKVSDNGFINNSEFYKFNNLQQLKILLNDENVFKTD